MNMIADSPPVNSVESDEECEAPFLYSFRKDKIFRYV